MAKLIRCASCGKLFEYDPKSRAIYCSAACRQKAHRMRHKGERVPEPFRENRECDNCGNSYVAVHPNQRYCSKHCKNQVAYQIRKMDQEVISEEEQARLDHIGSM